MTDEGRRDGHRPAYVLHDHRRPRPHFDLRLEEGGVLRSWAVPKGLPTSSRHLIHPQKVEGGRVRATDESGHEKSFSVHRITGATLES